MFTQELLDSWLLGICGTGGTCQDIFSSWASKTLSASASLQKLGIESKVGRRRGNEAFSAFLKTLKFVKEEHLHDLFSCRNFEKNSGAGTREIDGVVMDGTALGILGKLPTFHLHKKLFQQYLEFRTSNT